MSPTSLVQGYTINSLPPVVTVASELPGGLFEVELLVGPPGGVQAYINKQLTIEQLADYISTLNPGTGTGSPAVSLTLTAAQALIGSGGVTAGVLYIISSPDWNTNTPNGAVNATVRVHASAAGEYASTGWAYDANDVLQPVRVNVAAGTVDTRPLRDLQLLVVKVDEVTGDFVAWVGQDIAPGYTIEERQIP